MGRVKCDNVFEGIALLVQDCRGAGKSKPRTHIARVLLGKGEEERIGSSTIASAEGGDAGAQQLLKI